MNTTEQLLREALKPFANLDISSADGLGHKDDRPIFGLNHTQFTVGDVRRARALLSAPVSSTAEQEDKP